MQQPKKRPDTPLAETPKPNYGNMKTTKRSFFRERPYTPTAQDSISYKQGFDKAVKGKNIPTSYNMKSKQEMRGYEEAVKRGLTPKRN